MHNKEILRYGDNLCAMKEFEHTLLKYTEEELQEIEKQIEAFSIDEENYEETPEELEQSWQQLVARLKRDGVWKEN